MIMRPKPCGRPYSPSVVPRYPMCAAGYAAPASLPAPWTQPRGDASSPPSPIAARCARSGIGRGDGGGGLGEGHLGLRLARRLRVEEAHRRRHAATLAARRSPCIRTALRRLNPRRRARLLLELLERLARVGLGAVGLDASLGLGACRRPLAGGTASRAISAESPAPRKSAGMPALAACSAAACRFERSRCCIFLRISRDLFRSLEPAKSSSFGVPKLPCRQTTASRPSAPPRCQPSPAPASFSAASPLLVLRLNCRRRLILLDLGLALATGRVEAIALHDKCGCLSTKINSRPPAGASRPRGRLPTRTDPVVDVRAGKGAPVGAG